MSDFNIDGTSKNDDDIDDEIIFEAWKKISRQVEDRAKKAPKKEMVPNPPRMNQYLDMMEFLQDKFKDEPQFDREPLDYGKNGSIQFCTNGFHFRGDDLKRFANGLKYCVNFGIEDTGELLIFEMVYKDVFIEKDKYEKYLVMKQKEKGDK